MKNSSTFRFLIFGLVSGLLINVFISFPSFASEDEEESFDESELYNAELTLDEQISMYHEQMNIIFNESIAQLIQLLSTNKDLSNEEVRKKVFNRVAVSDDVSDENAPALCAQRGEGMNLSTYCLAFRADNLYGNYREILFSRRGDFAGDASVDGLYPTQAEITDHVDIQRKRIDRELVDAKKTFEASLTAYQELQTAFPLHIQFEDMKDSLIKYRDRLVEIRKKVDEFPHRFIKATTDACK